MIAVNLTRYPAVGKETALRAQAIELAQHLNQRGQRITVVQRIGDPNGVHFMSTVLVTSMADIDRLIQEVADDTVYQTMVGQMAGLLRQPVGQQFNRVLVQPAQAGAAGIRRRMTMYPSPENQAALEQAATAYVPESHGMGRPTLRLLQPLYGPDRPSLVLVADYPSLEALEAFSTNLPANVAPFVVRVNALCRRPYDDSIYTILLPAPS